MRISDWSSDVCSSDLTAAAVGSTITIQAAVAGTPFTISAETTNGGTVDDQTITLTETQENVAAVTEVLATGSIDVTGGTDNIGVKKVALRSEEQTFELQTLMRISDVVFCWKKQKKTLLDFVTSASSI